MRGDRARDTKPSVRSLLLSVTASSERVAYRRRRLYDAARDLQSDVLEAAAAGATEDELVDAGVERGYVQQLLEDRTAATR